jgi:hypothetical protein
LRALRRRLGPLCVGLRCRLPLPRGCQVTSPCRYPRTEHRHEPCGLPNGSLPAGPRTRSTQAAAVGAQPLARAWLLHAYTGRADAVAPSASERQVVLGLTVGRLADEKTVRCSSGGSRLRPSPSRSSAHPARVSLRKCCESIRRLVIGSAGTMATRASTRQRAAPSGPNNAPRGSGKRQNDGNANPT